MSWGLAVALLALLIIAPVVFLVARRHWISRDGGVFACHRRIGSAWVIGMARYKREDLEWFRIFSFWFSPQLRFQRGKAVIVSVRAPADHERSELLAGERVLRIDHPETPASGPVDLAMDPGSLTGLMSWLEAAPPGLAEREV